MTRNHRRAVALGIGLAALVAAAEASAAGEAGVCVAAAEAAQTLRDERKLKLAREQMVACAREACPAAVRKDCAGWLAQLDASMPSIVLSAQDQGHHDLFQVRVSIDGKLQAESLDGKAITIDPGPHLLRFEIPGQPALEERVLVREGEQRRAVTVVFPAPKGAAPVEVEPVAPPKPTALPIAPIAPIATHPPEEPPAPAKSRVAVATIVLGSLGVAAMASFATFGILGKNELADLRSTCKVTRICTDADVSPAHTKLLVADVSLYSGIAAIGTATVLFFVLRKPAPVKNDAGLSLGGGPLVGGGGLATASGSF